MFRPLSRRILPTVGLALLCAAAPARAAMTNAEKAEVGAVVREYLIANPEVLLEAMDALEAKRNAEAADAQKNGVAALGPALTATPLGTALGNPDGDVTLVEFFDYNCGYCRRARADVEGLLASDPKLRVVLKEIPVLGEPSLRASRVSLAVRQVAPEKYAAFHEKLLGSKGAADEDAALGVAESLGIKEADVRAAMAAPEVQGVLAENNRFAEALRINGTPTYVIGGTVVPGAVGKEALATMVSNMRRCAKATC